MFSLWTELLLLLSLIPSSTSLSFCRLNSIVQRIFLRSFNNYRYSGGSNLYKVIDLEIIIIDTYVTLFSSDKLHGSMCVKLIRQSLITMS
jgi:hypothetical protein